MQHASLVMTIIGGVIAILAFIKNWGRDEKTNAVEIANIKKDIIAQDIAGKAMQEEMRREVSRLHNEFKELKNKQDTIQTMQHEMHVDIKVLLNYYKTD